MPTIAFALQHRLLDDLDGGASVSAGCVCLEFRVTVDLGLVACRRPLRRRFEPTSGDLGDVRRARWHMGAPRAADGHCWMILGV